MGEEVGKRESSGVCNGDVRGLKYKEKGPDCGASWNAARTRSNYLWGTEKTQRSRERRCELMITMREENVGRSGRNQIRSDKTIEHCVRR